MIYQQPNNWNPIIFWAWSTQFSCLLKPFLLVVQMRVEFVIRFCSQVRVLERCWAQTERWSGFTAKNWKQRQLFEAETQRVQATLGRQFSGILLLVLKLWSLFERQARNCSKTPFVVCQVRSQTWEMKGGKSRWLEWLVGRRALRILKNITLLIFLHISSVLCDIASSSWRIDQCFVLSLGTNFHHRIQSDRNLVHFSIAKPCSDLPDKVLM